MALLDLPEKIRLPDRVGLHFPGEHPFAKKLINLALSGKFYPRFQISLGFEQEIRNPSLIGGIWNQCSPQLVFHTGAHAPALPRWSGGPYLRPLEACHLGSINLSFLASGREVDWGKFRRIIRTAVHLLDNLFEVTTFPLEATRRETLNHRKIGLGVMGFAELLEKLGYPYSSEATLVLSEKLMGFLFQEAARASRDLAKLRGAFPGFSEEHWRSHGGLRRHGNLGGMCSAPELAQLAGVTPGLDPKNTLSSDEKEAWLQRVQGAWEAACDGSVGIHIPAGDSKSLEALKRDLQLAESLALKQLTLEQNFWIQQEELQEELPDTTEEIEETTETPQEVSPSLSRPRPSVLTGRTRQISEGTLSCLITLACDEVGPRELLLRAGKAGSLLNAEGEALSRLVTLLFGMGMDSKIIADELSGIEAKGEEPTLAEVIARFLKEENQEEEGLEEEEITEVVALESVH
jgi:ribonucleoside-diphosphate reductase alpha chain